MSTAINSDIPVAAANATDSTQKKKQKKQKIAPPVSPIEQPQPPTTTSAIVTLAATAVATHSPILDLLHKRTRNFLKKIQRIKEYLDKPEDSLNADQRKAVATLPHLEAVVHELEDIKKAIEPIETQLEQTHAQELSRMKEESESRVNDAMSSTKLSCIPVLASIISYISSEFDTLHFSDASESDIDAARQLMNQLKQQEQSTSKDEVLAGLVTGSGTFNDVPYTRLLQLISTTTTLSQTQDEVVTQEFVEPTPAPSESASDTAAPIAGGSVTEGGLGGSFHFMQASELDEGAPILQDTLVNGLIDHVATGTPASDQHEGSPLLTEQSLQPPTTTTDNLDWAADDSMSSELPSINSLHAKFGTSPGGSGTTTPVAAPATSDTSMPPPLSQTTEDDFVAVRRGAPKGEGIRGGPHGGSDRGRGNRGGFRGGRGGWRNESESRGRGGFRGNDGGRGWRGSFRGPRGRGVTPVVESTS